MIKDELMDIEYSIDATTWKYSSKTGNRCEFIMLHHTGDDLSLKSEVHYLSEVNSEASVQYVIDKEWLIGRIGMDGYVLWHAGRWDLLKGYEDKMNRYSIGIEVISKGKTFTKKQINSLYKLVKALQKKHNIPNEKVIRHKDYTNRKIDISDAFYRTVGYTSFSEWKQERNYTSILNEKNARIEQLEKYLKKNRKQKDILYSFLSENTPLILKEVDKLEFDVTIKD